MILFRPIKPGTKFRSSVFRETVASATRATLKEVRHDFDKTVRTWRTKPTFKEEVRVGALARGKGPGVSLSVTTDSDIYKFVDEGTRVRYATMSKDFRAKTKPNVIGSGGGRGKLLFVNKRRPRPGIKARNFSKLIKQKWQGKFRADMRAALHTAKQKSGHAK